MSPIEQYRALARYNRWLNRKLYEVAAQLEDQERKRDRRAFFGSLHGTLNHILLADRAWMLRLTGDAERYSSRSASGELIALSSLAQILYEDFDVLLRERERTDEAILRADAGPHAFLRNTLMETIVLQNGLSLTVQPSLPVPLVINGGYNGLYRWMPPKDAQWLRQVIGADEVDVLHGPGFEPIAGRDDHFRKGLEHLIGGSGRDSISAYFDLESLIDLACIDLFTGRADHDLNVRAFRDRNGGKWRWILYDMDLWAPVNDNSLERMITAPATETPFLPQLIGSAELRKELMARIAALITGPLDPINTIAIADSIYDRNSEALERDHERWKEELKNPSPAESLKEMKEFLRSRGNVVLEQLARYTDQKLVEVEIEVPERSVARMELNGIVLQPGKRKIRLFRGIPMEISITPTEGTIFQGWSGHSVKDRTITIDPATVKRLKPRLK